jgi:hypothetical protein
MLATEVLLALASLGDETQIGSTLLVVALTKVAKASAALKQQHLSFIYMGDTYSKISAKRMKKCSQQSYNLYWFSRSMKPK